MQGTSTCLVLITAALTLYIPTRRGAPHGPATQLLQTARSKSTLDAITRGQNVSSLKTWHKLVDDNIYTSSRQMFNEGSPLASESARSQSDLDHYICNVYTKRRERQSVMSGLERRC